MFRVLQYRILALDQKNSTALLVGGECELEFSS